MLQQCGLFSQGGRVPAMQHPKQTTMCLDYVPGLPVNVVNVPTDLRSQLAAAMQVPINMFNAQAFIQCTAVRVVTSTYDIPYTRVTASTPTAGGWLTVGQWKTQGMGSTLTSVIPHALLPSKRLRLLAGVLFSCGCGNSDLWYLTAQNGCVHSLIPLQRGGLVSLAGCHLVLQAIFESHTHSSLVGCCGGRCLCCCNCDAASRHHTLARHMS